ncbi:hypothetical protein TeGR_g6745, partial [Tetraparma gracilis]
DDESEVRAGLANEFNTLSICYGKTAEHFVADENRVRQGDAQADAAAAAIADMGIAAPAPAPAPVATSDSQGNAAYDDLLGFASGGEVGAATGAALGGAGEVDLLGGFGGEVGGGAAAGGAAAGGMKLDPTASVDGQTYQSMWGQLPESVNQMIPLGMSPITATQAVE